MGEPPADVNSTLVMVSTAAEPSGSRPLRNRETPRGPTIPRDGATPGPELSVRPETANDRTDANTRTTRTDVRLETARRQLELLQTLELLPEHGVDQDAFRGAAAWCLRHRLQLERPAAPPQSEEPPARAEAAPAQDVAPERHDHEECMPMWWKDMRDNTARRKELERNSGTTSSALADTTAGSSTHTSAQNHSSPTAYGSSRSATSAAAASLASPTRDMSSRSAAPAARAVTSVRLDVSRATAGRSDIDMARERRRLRAVVVEPVGPRGFLERFTSQPLAALRSFPSLPGAATQPRSVAGLPTAPSASAPVQSSRPSHGARRIVYSSARAT